LVANPDRPDLLRPGRHGLCQSAGHGRRDVDEVPNSPTPAGLLGPALRERVADGVFDRGCVRAEVKDAGDSRFGVCLRPVEFAVGRLVEDKPVRIRDGLAERLLEDASLLVDLSCYSGLPLLLFPPFFRCRWSNGGTSPPPPVCALDLERSPLGAVRQNDQVLVEDLDRNGDPSSRGPFNPVHEDPARLVGDPGRIGSGSRILRIAGVGGGRSAP